MMSRRSFRRFRPRKDKRGVDLVSDVLPFGRLWYGEPNAISNAIDYAKFRSHSCRAVIRVYDDAGQCDQDARTRARFQRVVALDSFTDYLEPLLCRFAHFKLCAHLP